MSQPPKRCDTEPAIGSDASWRPLYPFRDHWLTIDGCRLHYLDEGAGEPLLLVHGNPTWSFHWRNLILALRGNYRLIVPDHLGCGLSDKPKDYPYLLARRIGHLQALVRLLDLRGATLVAHDWGGAIGLGMVLEDPERFRRLVLMNTAAFRARRMPWRIRVCRTPGLGRIAVQGVNAFARAALLMAVCHRQRMTAPVRSGYLAPYGDWSARRAVYEFVKDIPMSARHRSWQTLTEIEERLANLAHLPTLLIWGMRDWCFTRAFLERFREFFPAAEVFPIADAGHYVVEDAHERIAPRILDFLARHPVSAIATPQPRAAPALNLRAGA